MGGDTVRLSGVKLAVMIMVFNGRSFLKQCFDFFDCEPTPVMREVGLAFVGIIFAFVLPIFTVKFRLFLGALCH